MSKNYLLLNVLLVLILSSVICGCDKKERPNVKKEQTMQDITLPEYAKTYTVKRLGSPMAIDADWNKDQWKNVEPLTLENYMGDKPQHRPKTQAKVLYDDQNIYVIFRVEDQYVRAVAQKINDSVCGDSCAEFFFSPDPDSTKGYFNLEINCGGTALFYGGAGAEPSSIHDYTIDPEQIKKVEIAHSMPKIVEPEITEPTTWTLEYRLPLSLIAQRYPQMIKPAAGAVWRGNFYKCADQTSHQHWLTWSFVDLPQPNFHRPDFFGVLEFE